jgi:Synergist-CTERM protein sorting domain-containing protein
MKRLVMVWALTLGLGTLSSKPAAAHGINGHIWVTDGGIERMADCEFASVLLGDPALRAAIQIGAAFPDSGYALDAGREYGETAHWEPFVDAFIRYMRATYKPPYDTFEEKQLIAFLMGFASHGMEDEVFDTIFLPKSLEAEGADQDLLDPGTDFMLIADGHATLKPDIFLPAQDLLAVYADPKINVDAEAATMDQGMFIIRNVVIALVDQDDSIDDNHRPELPWSAAHYLDPETPGSLAWEKAVIGPYLDSIWHRLHDDFQLDDVVVHTVPAEGERLLSNDHTSVDSRVSVIFGYGVWNRSLTADNVKLLDPDGKAVPAEIAYTRWGNPTSDGRMVQLRPQVDLLPDATYQVVIGKNVELIDGRNIGADLKFTVHSACGGSCPTPEAPVETPYCSAETESTAAKTEPRSSAAAGGCTAGGNQAPFWLLLAALPMVLRRRQK